VKSLEALSVSASRQVNAVFFIEDAFFCADVVQAFYWKYVRH
jgi:hypothetical protein